MQTQNERSLETIRRIRSPQIRGYRFQEVLRHLLADSRFEVDPNPRSAKPRQSDLFAMRDDKEYLIEAKWRNKKIYSGDIDDIRVRLRRVPPGVIGCLFSMSEYAATAIKAVEDDRTSIILLFAPHEIREMARRSRDIDELFKLKRMALIRNGTVWFSHQAEKHKSSRHLLLPQCSRALVQAGEVVRCCANPGSDNDVMFATEIPDIRWGDMRGNGVGISIRLPIQTHSDLKHFLALLHNQLGLSSEGSFTIRQLQCSWHGYGIANLLSLAEKWNHRYKAANLSYVHHSEDIHYFDSCSSGFCLLTLRQGVNPPRPRPFDSGRLEIQLSGIPVNLKPYLRICEEARAGDQFFVPFNEIMLDEVRLKTPILVKPTGLIVSTLYGAERAVCGLIIKNPFKNKALIPTGQLEYSPFKFLGATDLLICQLSDWHDVGDVIDHYRLTRLEGVQVDQAVVFRCVGTWDSILKRARPFPDAVSRRGISASVLGKTVLNSGQS